MPFLPVIEAPPAAPVEDVVVTASRSGTTLADMPLHTTVISSEDIAASPARSLDQLLRNVPGVNLTGVPATQSDPTGHQTRMRGLGNAKVLVLVDGVPVHDPFYLTTQWFKVPLARVERVEVLRGGYSSLWGNMAVAGVINVITRQAREDGLEVRLGAGSRGSRSAALSADWRVTESLGVNLSVDQIFTAGYASTPREHAWRFPERDTADARNTNATLTLRYDDSDGWSGFLRAGYHVQDQDISYRFGSNQQRNPDASIGVTREFGRGARWQSAAWAQTVDFDKYNGATCYFQPAGGGARCPNANAVTPVQVNDDVLQYYTQHGLLGYRERGASTVLSLPFGSWLKAVQVGADVRRLSASDDETFYGAPTNRDAPQANVASATHGAGVQRFLGAFLQLQLAPLPAVDVTLAARHDSWRNHDREFVRTRADGTATGGVVPDSSHDAFDPSVAVRWQAAAALALRGAAYRSFRAPGFNNTLRTFGTTTPTIANPDLGPETLKGWEIGADLEAGEFSASGTYFRYAVRDQIATFRVNGHASAPPLVRTICSDGGPNLANCGGAANFYTNDQDSESHGLELSLDWKALPGLQLGADYTRTISRLTRRGAVVTDPLGVQLAGLPRDVAVLRARWSPTYTLGLHAQARYIGSLLYDTTSVPGTVFRQGSNVVVDARATYARERWDVSAGVVNLLDREYSEGSYTVSQPWNRTLSAPRTFNAELRWRF